MKICRFVLDGRAVWGRVEERGRLLWIVGAAEDAEAAWDGALSTGFVPMLMMEAELLAPVEPSKIVCVGRNYRDHAKELGNEVPTEPLLFFKPPSALLEPGGVVRMPSVAERVDYEGELALVMGKRARRLKAADDWRGFVRGYTLANDVSARDLQKKDGQWTRAKGFDTFCPVGPLVSDEIDPENVTLETRVNGELRQRGETRDFIFRIPELLEYITAAMTLEAGDVVLTGTPAGVGPVAAGDVVEISVPGLGILSNAFAPDAH
jgi:2-keto-4-pentenoate hydratase/2-oxohepta-3-ene-1,7-dioic acid hydratase in catechol pathway